jgi:hypothetical protein
MNYIIQFSHREQYDCAGNSTVKSEAKCFNEDATIKDIVDWVKETAGPWGDDVNLLTNPQIIGIRKG